MSMWILIPGIVLACLLVAALIVWKLITARDTQYWIGSYLFPSEPAPPRWEDQEIDVFFAICDHWEPRCYGASDELARERVHRWRTEYPKSFSQFHDINGRSPQHTFFFPEDEYRPEYLDVIRGLVEEGYGDVDVHLHHYDDTAEQLREKLDVFRDTLYHQHGLLRRDPVTGRVVYGFIHGNWALCNSRPDGLCCGVNNELTILQETGCYADFTLPSAPSATQTRTINSIYYAKDLPGKTKSHDTGIRARVGQTAPQDHLLMIQGPLQPDWGWRAMGIWPRIENSDLHGGRAATIRRMKMWLSTGVHVAGRPEWRFIKLHAHGCKNENIDTMLGEPMIQFHRDLQQFLKQHQNIRLHYVTAWEMAQLVHQAERGETVPNLSQVPSSLLSR